MKKHFTFFVIIILCMQSILKAQQNLDSVLPVRGFCVGAPKPKDVDAFTKFIAEELAPRKVNTLIVRIDYNYQFKSHPEFTTDSLTLTKNDVKKMVGVCKKNHIRLIPQINLLGHQSWANHTGKLLSVYKEFDETPWLNMPLQYSWPNADSLYCKSYCPLHPGVHKIILDVIDEI